MVGRGRGMKFNLFMRIYGENEALLRKIQDQVRKRVKTLEKTNNIKLYTRLTQ